MGRFLMHNLPQKYICALAASALFAAVGALYGGFLSSPVVFDDLYMFDGHTLSYYGHSLFSFTLRWFPYASFGWTWNLFGENLVWFRLGNLLLHAATAVALFLFLRSLFKAVLPHEEGRLSHTGFAFLGALLFALHPVAVFAAGYLVERSIVMATLFGLLTLYAYLRGLLSNKQGWFIASAFLYFLAVYSKEHAVMIPAVALALTFLLYSPSRELFGRIALPFFLFALIGISIVLKIKGVIGSPYEPFAMDMLKGVSDSAEKIDVAYAYPLSIETQSLLFFKYLGLWLLPNPAWMSVDMREPFAASLFDWRYVLAVAGFLAYGAVAFWLLIQRGKKGLLGFAMLFPWLLFATEFSTVRIQESFVLYRSYLWMVGLFAILPVLFSRVPARKAAIWLLLTGAFYVPLSLDRLHTFSNPLFLWDDAVRLVEDRQNLPGVARIYHNRGIAFFHVNLKEKALEDYNTALRLKADDSYTYNDRGALHFDQGRYQEAMRDFDKAISLNPDVGHFFWARGKVFEAQGDLPTAEINYRKGCELGEVRACDKSRTVAK